MKLPKFAFQTSVVQVPKPPKAVPAEKIAINPETVNQIVKNAVFVVGTAYAGSKALNTVSEIAIIAAKAKFK